MWIPALLFWMCSPYLLFDIIRSNIGPIRWNAYNTCRLLVSCALTIASLVDLIVCLLREFHFEDSITVAHLTSSAIYFLTRFVLTFVLYWQRVSAIHCSGIVWFYLLFDTFFGALGVASFAQTEGLRQTHEYYLYIIQFSLTAILFLFCCFADRLPPNTFSDEKLETEPRVCPKHLVSFPSRLTFWWVTGLITKGWNNPLTTDDLWDVRREDRCRNVFKYFNKYWKSEKFETMPNENVVFQLGGKGDTSYKYKSIQNLDQTGAKRKPTKLLSVIAKAFWFYFLTPNLLKLVADIVQLANPMIMK